MVFQPSVPAQSVSEGSYVSYNNAVVFHGVPRRQSGKNERFKTEFVFFFSLESLENFVF